MVNGRSFLERPERVAFWVMMSLCLALLAYFYAATQLIDYILVCLLITGIIVLKVAWGMFAWRRPLMVEIEKAERVAFWVMSLFSLGLLAFEYATTGFFDHHVFFVFIIGQLAYYLTYIIHLKRRDLKNNFGG